MLSASAGECLTVARIGLTGGNIRGEAADGSGNAGSSATPHHQVLGPGG